MIREPPEPPWDEIDSGILETVRLFYDAGVPTIYSCQGGKGHADKVPTVRCPKYVSLTEIMTALRGRGGYTIRQGYHMTMTEKGMRQKTYWEIIVKEGKV